MRSKEEETLQRSRDTGLAMVLVCLLLLWFWPRQWLIGTALLLLVATMLRPQLFAPAAGLWFGLSQTLGTFVSRVLLSIIFFVVVTPVALIRRGIGADPLQLKRWRQDRESVFAVRSRTYTGADLERPY